LSSLTTRILPLTSNNLNVTLCWWLLLLLIIPEFNVCIINHAGATNHAADALSHLPLLEPEEPLSVEQMQDHFHKSYLFYLKHRMIELSPVTITNLVQRAQAGDGNLIVILLRSQTYIIM
jgi:hypothetical protein